MNKRTILFLTALMLSALGPVQAADNRPALWAVYYAWYETGIGPHGRWRMWSNDQTKTANPKPHAKAQPLIGYYDSDDPEVVRWHIRLAKAAGIDAFLVSWWGGANISGQAFEKVILPVAAEENFKVALCSELAQFHHDVKVLTRQTSLFIPENPGRVARRRVRAAAFALMPVDKPRLNPLVGQCLRFDDRAHVAARAAFLFFPASAKNTALTGGQNKRTMAVIQSVRTRTRGTAAGEALSPKQVELMAADSEAVREGNQRLADRINQKSQ